MRLPFPVLAGALALSQACGGDGGPGPSAVGTPGPAPEPIAFSVVSGETSEPIAGARVVVAGQEYMTDARGAVTVPASLGPSTLIDVMAAGHFDRQTVLSRRGTAGRFTVWPRESATRLTEHATAELVYTTAGVDEEPVIGAVPLRRWASSVSRVEVVFQGSADSPQFVDFSPRVRDVQRAALDEMNRANGGQVVYVQAVPGAQGSPAGRIDVRIFPEYVTCQPPGRFAAAASLAEGEIRTATVTYCSERWAESLAVAVHEFGHTFGLRHSSDGSDAMFASTRHPGSFSARETLLMGLMLQRPAGNRFPDNDRSARATSARVRDTACGP